MQTLGGDCFTALTAWDLTHRVNFHQIHQELVIKVLLVTVNSDVYELSSLLMEEKMSLQCQLQLLLHSMITKY